MCGLCTCSLVPFEIFIKHLPKLRGHGMSNDDYDDDDNSGSVSAHNLEIEQRFTAPL